MDEHNHQVQQNQQVEKIKTRLKITWKIIIIAGHIIVIAILAFLLWYFIQQNNTKTSLLNKNKTEIISLKKIIDSAATSVSTNNTSAVKCNDEPAVVEPAPTAAVIESIKGSITSGNTQALEGHMASSVNVILAATEAYGMQTALQAVSELTSFINPATTWDFALGSSILGSYGRGSYSQYFPNNAIVGRSADNKVISFSFDTDGNVSVVFMAASEDLLQ